MAAKTIDDVLGNQEKFLARIRKLSTTTGDEAGLEPGDVLKGTAELIDNLKQRLEATATARKAAMSRFDEEMAHYEGQIRRLEQTLKEQRERLEKADDRSRKPQITNRPTKRGKKKPPE